MERTAEIVMALCQILPNIGVYIFLQSLVPVISYIYSHYKPGGLLRASPVKGAQFGKIIWRRRLFTYQASSPMDFLCVYHTTVRPEYVLRRNVSLYCIMLKDAYFIETPVDMNIYSSDENPFMYLAQFNGGQNIIKMPIHTFHTLADKIGDPRVPVIWVSNIGRCGSTLLGQVFERVPGTCVLSEPDATLNICELRSKNQISEKEYEDLLRSTIRIICKQDTNIKRFVVKTRSTCASLLLVLSKIYPNHVQQIFMYRNSLETIASNSVAVTPYSVLLRAFADNDFVSSIFPVFRKQFRFERQCKIPDFPDVPLERTFEQQVHIWANFVILGRHAISRDPNIIPLKYEDVISNPNKTIQTIFQTLGIPLEHSDKAVSSLDRDSQRGTSISGRKSKNSPRRRISAENWTIANKILSSYNLPQLGEQFVI